MSDQAHLKTPLAESLPRIAQAAAGDRALLAGKSLPCSVVEVVSSGIVTVKFEVNSDPWTLPQVTMPILGAEYVRYPIKVGDKGMAVAAGARLGGLSGLGGGVAGLDQPANLSALSFMWLGSTEWSDPGDSQAVVLYGPNGTVMRDTRSASVVTVAPSQITHDSPVTVTSGNFAVGSGFTGTATTPTGLLQTFERGVLVNMAGTGGLPINLAYFSNFTAQITAFVDQLEYIKSGGFGQSVVEEVQQQLLAELQTLANQLMADLQAQVTAIASQVTSVAPMVATAALPTVDLTTVIAFLNSFKLSVLAPIIAPYSNLLAQVSGFANQVAELTSALQEAASAMGGTVNVPAVHSSTGVGSAAGSATVQGVSG
jgi:hypothetical protein